MKLQILHRLKRLFFPLLFIFYLGNITLFTHFHVVNGVVIVHSHPSKKSHQHSPQEYKTIFILSNFLSTTLTYTTFISPVVWTLLMIVITPFLQLGKRIELRDNYSRAPPRFSLL